MKILLLGEYSNVHWTLAQGLRARGHEVVVASGGDSWKNYPRDVDLAHRRTPAGHLSFLRRLLAALPEMRGYDIVQLINPVFLEMRPEPHKYIFDNLCRNNRHVVLGAFGMDSYWVRVNRDLRPMRYSDFNLGNHPRTDSVALQDIATWTDSPAERLTRYVAARAEAIVAGLYEYWLTYQYAESGTLRDKTVFIPFPIDTQHVEARECGTPHASTIRIFVGISKGRSAYKGTDIMLRAARRIKEEFPDVVELRVAEGVPFAQYREMMRGSDLILDQLYSYTPAMNALLAMSQGIICVGGGEPEHYDLLGESQLRPIVNVEPSEDSVYEQLRELVTHPERLPLLKQQSMDYVRLHHDVANVAEKYEAVYRRLCNP